MHHQAILIINQLSHRYPSSILKGFISYLPYKEKMNKYELKEWWKNFSHHLNQINQEYNIYYKSGFSDTEINTQETETKLYISQILNGVESIYNFNFNFF